MSSRGLSLSIQVCRRFTHALCCLSVCLLLLKKIHIRLQCRLLVDFFLLQLQWVIMPCSYSFRQFHLLSSVTVHSVFIGGLHVDCHFPFRFAEDLLLNYWTRRAQCYMWCILHMQLGLYVCFKAYVMNWMSLMHSPIPCCLFCLLLWEDPHSSSRPSSCGIFCYQRSRPVSQVTFLDPSLGSVFLWTFFWTLLLVDVLLIEMLSLCVASMTILHFLPSSCIFSCTVVLSQLSGTSVTFFWFHVTYTSAPSSNCRFQCIFLRIGWWSSIAIDMMASFLISSSDLLCCVFFRSS